MSTPININLISSNHFKGLIVDNSRPLIEAFLESIYDSVNNALIHSPRTRSVFCEFYIHNGQPHLHLKLIQEFFTELTRRVKACLSKYKTSPIHWIYRISENEDGKLIFRVVVLFNARDFKRINESRNLQSVVELMNSLWRNVASDYTSVVNNYLNYVRVIDHHYLHNRRKDFHYVLEKQMYILSSMAHYKGNEQDYLNLGFGHSAFY